MNVGKSTHVDQAGNIVRDVFGLGSRRREVGDYHLIGGHVAAIFFLSDDDGGP